MLRTSVGSPDFDAIFDGSERDIASFVTAAMRDTTVDTVDVFRDQVRAAGLGEKLPNAVRGKTYPQTKDSLEPGGWVYAQPSKTGRGAAAIIDSYANGRMIVPRAGKRWLLVPSDDCPRKRGGEALSYAEVEEKFGRLQWIPAKAKYATPSARRRGSYEIVTKSAVIRKATQRWRRATPKELAGKTRNPRPVQTVIMFTAVRAVKKPRSIDMSVPQDFAGIRFEQNLDKHWR